MNEYIIPVERLKELQNAVDLWSNSLKSPVVLQTFQQADLLKGGTTSVVVTNGKVRVRLVGEPPDEVLNACELAQADGGPISIPEPVIHVGNELSEFVGTPKTKLEIVVELYHVNEWEGDFGTSYIHKMRDLDGNELVWFSSGKQYRAGQSYLLKGTVKEHSVYSDRYTGRDIKQTKLTRCKLSEPVSEKEVYVGKEELDDDGTAPF